VIHAPRNPEHPALAEPAGGPTHSDLPAMDFISFVSGLAATTFYHLGAQPGESQTSYTEIPGAEIDLAQAQLMIDLLALLAAKTQGNLNDEETRHLKAVRAELQLLYVKRASALKSTAGTV